MSSADYVSRGGAPFPSWGALRLSAKKNIDDEGAFQDAIKLAKESDGKSIGLFLKLDAHERQSLSWSLARTSKFDHDTRLLPISLTVFSSGVRALTWIP